MKHDKLKNNLGTEKLATNLIQNCPRVQQYQRNNTVVSLLIVVTIMLNEIKQSKRK